MSTTSSHRAWINLSNLRDLTIEHGEGWGYPHVCRVLRLIEEIGVGLAYDQNVVLYAAYLHDWGTFPCYYQQGVDHSLRSMQVAEKDILPHTTLSETARQAVLDAIALHDYRDLRPATAAESLLLREANMLDRLGVVGILREFAWGPNNLRLCYERVLAQKAGIAGRLTLPKAQTLARERLHSMEQMLARFKIESFDLL
jgi:HD superfamily phosphodiesterase